MTTRVKLIELQQEADETYGNYEIELAEGESPLVLVPVLRLDATKIQQFYQLQERLSKLGADKKNNAGGNTITEIRNVLQQMLKLAAQDGNIADQFLADHGDDLIILQTVFSGYMQATQVGEASASPNS